MEYVSLTRENAEAARALWNRGAQKDFPHKAMDEDTFVQKFLLDDTYVGVVAMENGELAGLVGGNVALAAEKAYVTAIYVSPLYRRQGVGTELLGRLEEALIARGEGKVTKIEFSFFNPATLEWIVPGTDGHDHPNAPGVDISAPVYLFLENHGYRTFAHQNSYYIRLSDYEYPADIVAKLENLKQRDITITYYDKDKHYGMAELLDNLDSEIWKRDVTAEIERPDGGRPLLIVEHKGRIVGFTGPLDVQPSGRGFFLGIGIHSDFRGGGAGKSLFAALCKGLKDIGADFMTLFTGEANPARNIYEAAGFKIVKSWMNMRKEVN